MHVKGRKRQEANAKCLCDLINRKLAAPGSSPILVPITQICLDNVDGKKFQIIF